MNEMDMALLRHEKRKNGSQKKEDNNFISKCFTKVLLSVIFVLSSTIYIKLSPDNLTYFKKQIFESNLTFTKINNWYHDTFGSILPTVKEPTTNEVSSNVSVNELEKYLDGYKVHLGKSMPVTSLASGILVYMGEKEGYGNTLIVQGVDGVDIWYGGITDSNLKLYDYLDKDTILGNTVQDDYSLVFQGDGRFLTYEEYQNNY